MNKEHEQPTIPATTSTHDVHKDSHRWMMVACCIPMLGIAILLVATGVLSASFLIFAVICTLMMTMMMRGMDHGGGTTKP